MVGKQPVRRKSTSCPMRPVVATTGPPDVIHGPSPDFQAYVSAQTPKLGLVKVMLEQVFKHCFICSTTLTSSNSSFCEQRVVPARSGMCSFFFLRKDLVFLPLGPEVNLYDPVLTCHMEIPMKRCTDGKKKEDCLRTSAKTRPPHANYSPV